MSAARFKEAEPDIPISEQVAEAERELRRRRVFYPRSVLGGSMSQLAADKNIAAMAAILKTLEGLST